MCYFFETLYNLCV